MATTLSTFALGETTTRYHEPYVTEGLNKKLAVNTPPGTYRGFRLGTNGAALTVTVVADPTFNDHSAVYETSGGASLTVRKTGGNFNLDLTALASKTVVICLYATYGVGFTTTAELRAYEFAPSDTFTGAPENAELVVLGTVVVPAAGVIGASSIKHDRRRMAWMANAPDAVAWTSVLRNGGFEYGEDDGTYPHSASHWIFQQNGNLKQKVQSTDPHSGSRALAWDALATGVQSGTAVQYVGMPVVPGQLIRYQFFVKNLKIASSGSFTLFIDYENTSFVATSFSVVSVVVNAVDASYREYSGVVAVPASMANLRGVSFSYALNQGTTGVALRVDDVAVWVEGNASKPAGTEDRIHQYLSGKHLVLEDSDTSATDFHGIAALIYQQGDELLVERRDQDVTSGNPIEFALKTARLTKVGKDLLSTATRARLPRVSVPFSQAQPFTLLWESTPATAGSSSAIRLYATDIGALILTNNASYDGTNWNKDLSGTAAFQMIFKQGKTQVFFRANDQNTAWLNWTRVSETNGAEAVTTSNLDFGPLLAFFDSAGNRRVAFDHVGVPRRQSQFVVHQNWIAPMLASWTTNNSGGGASNTAVVDTTSNKPGVWMKHTITSNTERASLYSPQIVKGPWNADLFGVIEFDVDATDLVGTPSLTFQLGFIHDETVEPTSEDQLKVFKSSASANWRLLTNGGAGPTNVDTTVAAAAAIQRFRLEVYGSNWPGGQRALLFIDGTLVAQSTTNFPVDDPMMIVTYLKSTGATSKSVYVSPISCTLVRRLTDDPV